MAGPAAVGLTRSRAWQMVGLLFLIQMVNFADKSALSLAAPALMSELKMSAADYGLLASSFFSLYAVSGLALGFLVAPRVRPRPILTVLLLIWSLSQLPIMVTNSFAMLVACRVVLGMGEGGATPTVINACHEWFPSERRNMPTAVVMFGATAGSLLAAPVLSYVIAAYGWRAAFGVCSAFGIVVMLLWMWLGADGPDSGTSRDADAKISSAVGPRVTILELWKDPLVLGSLVVGLCSYYIVGFSVSWLAPYVSLVLGFDRISTGWMVAIIYIIHAFVVFGISYVSERVLRRGGSSRLARGLVNAACLFAAALCFIALTFVDGQWERVLIMAVATALPALTFTLNPALLAEIAPHGHRNRLIAVMLAAVTFAGIISPGLSGKIIADDGMDGWDMVLAINASVCLLGSLASAALLKPEAAIARFARRAHV